MSEIAIQDRYPDELSHCYGCGRLNPDGYQIKTRWDGDETVSFFTPEARHMAIPGFVYGGLLASLVDCHGTGTAAAAAARQDGLDLSVDPAPRFVTGSLKVQYVRPTPLGPQLEIRGRVKEISGRKVIIEASLSAEGEVCVRGEVIAIRLKDE